MAQKAVTALKNKGIHAQMAKVSINDSHDPLHFLFYYLLKSSLMFDIGNTSIGGKNLKGLDCFS